MQIMDKPAEGRLTVILASLAAIWPGALMFGYPGVMGPSLAGHLLDLTGGDFLFVFLLCRRTLCVFWHPAASLESFLCKIVSRIMNRVMNQNSSLPKRRSLSRREELKKGGKNGVTGMV